MSQSHNIVHNRNDKGNSSTIVTDDNGAWSLFQSCVDDIPFQFNPKYRHITIPNIDIPEYDNAKVIHRILSKKIDFTLESKVIQEALEDLKRKKKDIESDNLLKQPKIISAISDSSHQLSDSFSISKHTMPVNDSSSSSSSACFPSVRDIKWPSNDSQECNLPLLLNAVKQSNQASNNTNSTPYINDLAATFDETLTSNDPFNDAELKSLNDAVELNHLYSSMGLANTIRR